MSDYSDIIARLETATGTPPRALNEEIFWMIRGAREGSHFGGFPYYTTSIDAALALVPEWHKWSVACGRLVQYVARVTPVKAHHGCSDGECDSTPAIALCIAALKARAALKTAHQSEDSE